MVAPYLENRASGNNYYGEKRHGGYGYIRNVSRGLGYLLVDTNFSYGTDVDLKSYLRKNKQGIAGYSGKFLDALIRGSIYSGLYPLQKQSRDDIYKIREMMLGYESKALRDMKYELPGRKKPLTNLEEELLMN